MFRVLQRIATTRAHSLSQGSRRLDASVKKEVGKVSGHKVEAVFEAWGDLGGAKVRAGANVGLRVLS